jgi:putative ABC transport system substrate-binding protein
MFWRGRIESFDNTEREKLMRNKLIPLAFGAMLFALCVSAQAQQPTKILRIGFFPGGGEAKNARPQIQSFLEGLRGLGYDGKNILIEDRYSEKNLEYSSLVADLLRLKVDVLVAQPLSAIRAAKKATQTVPIVMVTTVDPVANGIVDSLARPGGNVTGLATLGRELSGKRLELFKEMVPRISRIGVLGDSNTPVWAITLKEYETAARALKIELKPLEAGGPNPDLERAFQAASKARADALITIATPLLARYRKQIADLAIKSRLPSTSDSSAWVDAGFLMSYSADIDDQYRRAAVFVDKILKGAKPADLPVEQPTKFEFIINLKTAKQIGLTIPPNVLARADKVIR